VKILAYGAIDKAITLKVNAISEKQKQLLKQLVAKSRLSNGSSQESY
jgi:hypothetical protein